MLFDSSIESLQEQEDNEDPFAEALPMRPWNEIRLSEIWIPAHLLPSRNVPFQNKVAVPSHMHTLEKPTICQECFSVYDDKNEFDTESSRSLLSEVNLITLSPQSSARDNASACGSENVADINLPLHDSTENPKEEFHISLIDNLSTSQMNMDLGHIVIENLQSINELGTSPAVDGPCKYVNRFVSELSSSSEGEEDEDPLKLNVLECLSAPPQFKEPATDIECVPQCHNVKDLEPAFNFPQEEHIEVIPQSHQVENEVISPSCQMENVEIIHQYNQEESVNAITQSHQGENMRAIPQSHQEENLEAVPQNHQVENAETVPQNHQVENSEANPLYHQEEMAKTALENVKAVPQCHQAENLSYLDASCFDGKRQVLENYLNDAQRSMEGNLKEEDDDDVQKGTADNLENSDTSQIVYKNPAASTHSFANSYKVEEYPIELKRRDTKEQSLNYLPAKERKNEKKAKAKSSKSMPLKDFQECQEILPVEYLRDVDDAQEYLKHFIKNQEIKQAMSTRSPSHFPDLQQASTTSQGELSSRRMSAKSFQTMENTSLKSQSEKNLEKLNSTVTKNADTNKKLKCSDEITSTVNKLRLSDEDILEDEESKTLRMVMENIPIGTTKKDIEDIIHSFESIRVESVFFDVSKGSDSLRAIIELSSNGKMDWIIDYYNNTPLFGGNHKPVKCFKLD